MDDENKVEMIWFVLYVRTGSEDKVLKELMRLPTSDVFIPFIPMKILPSYKKDKNGKRQGVKFLCFPGYIFFRTVKTDTCKDEFIRTVVSHVTGFDGAYYFLYYGEDKRDIEVRAKEREKIERLMDSEYCINASLGFKEGDRVRVVEGPLVGLEGDISKIYRHGRIATLTTEMMGRKLDVTLMLEVVRKDEAIGT